MKKKQEMKEKEQEEKRIMVNKNIEILKENR